MTTRQQRIAAGGRRLETVAAAVTVLVAGALCAAVPEGGGEKRDAARASGITMVAEGVSRPGAVDAESPEADYPVMPRSAPTRLYLPQIGADIEVFGADAEPDGTPPVPDKDDADRAAWWRGGPSPGEQGPALLIGHLDSKKGAAAFAGVGSLEPGAEVVVERKDGSTVIFAVDSVEQYPKDDFPNERVYGPTENPQLRLITCGGTWTKKDGYDANIVAFASIKG
ncbi:class F sortase [Streptomyces sp. JJ38]|uniref:class F sortase n=1 Tax=Streptomyces sp. JJ38 TaxID=2738128 RepID=UPI001C589B5B|nr:class F sortase [Streptomyces sp. JJ38]MBW1600313.1 class F sortase [Streptomyces sp. JJ38]